MIPGDGASVADQIEAFVRTQFRVSPSDSRFSRNKPLFDLGYVDSVGVVELLDFISRRFGVRVPDDVLLSEEFSTIEGMGEVIARLREKKGRTPV